MSYYVWGSKMSYADYLTAKTFADDLTAAYRTAGRQVSMEISRHTRQVIASNEALARENIRVIEASTDRITGVLDVGFDRVTDVLEGGFERLSYDLQEISADLQEISAGLSELTATFHWGFSEMLVGIGRMNDALSELIKIAKTPAQTAAYEQYEIARNAFRRELYGECLEALEKAISGDHTSPGYKLEWRFYQMKGTLHLGFVGSDLSLMDLAQAEASFLLAARYAKMDSPEHAGHAFLSAGWAAYCQGKMQEALAHTEQAIAILPKLGEAFFQAAKVRMALGEVDKALPVLGKAIDLDRFYALKAAGDGDFQRHDEALRGFLEALRCEKYRQSLPRVQEALEKVRFWREHFSEGKEDEDIRRMETFLAEGAKWPLLDMLDMMQTLQGKIFRIEANAAVAVTIKVTEIARPYDETGPVEETYQEEVVIKPGGLFRKKITEMQTRTRTVIKVHTRSFGVIRDDIYTGLGERIASIEFCRVPAGTFMMGEKNSTQHPVTLTCDFYLGKYPVTQAQWEGVMGNNPSHFKGDPNRPVEQVSWEECQAFIKKLNGFAGKKIYRLPTEAEWEYACRASSTTNYCFGDDEGRLGQYAWYESNSGRETHPVGQKKPNTWGLYDMHGNVWEWCHDWYGDYPAVPVIDPQGPSSGSLRVSRGGSWNVSGGHCQSAIRALDTPGYRFDYLGFRLLRLIE